MYDEEPDFEAAVEVLRARDASIRRLIDRVGPCTLEARDLHSPFEALLRSIVYQQLSGKAAGTIYGRLLDAFPGPGGPDPSELIDAPVELLRSVGLSRNKARAAQDLAAKTLDGTVPATLDDLRQLSDEDIIGRLTQVRGIGPWTVQMLLMFNLLRPDVLPATDLGVQKGAQFTYGLAERPTPKVLLTIGEAWRPYRTVASWYMWRATELDWAGQ